jgi:hypothetical protein
MYVYEMHAYEGHAHGMHTHKVHVVSGAKLSVTEVSDPWDAITSKRGCDV